MFLQTTDQLQFVSHELYQHFNSAQVGCFGSGVREITVQRQLDVFRRCWWSWNNLF